MQGVGRVTNLLAFFLPLKVILLAGTDGVPRYFQAFVDFDQKTSWIIWLTVAAFVCFVLTIILERNAARVAGAAGAKVAAAASRLAVVDNQDTQAQAYFGRICGIAANLVFMLTAFLAGLFLNWPVFLLVLGLLVLQFIASTWLLGQLGTGSIAGRMGLFAVGNPGDFSKALSSSGFLIGFLMILHPFIFGGGQNILIAILSVVLLRQALNALPAIIGDATNLLKNRHKIDALVFPEIPLQPPEKRERQALRVAFRKADRERDVLSVLNSEGRKVGGYEVIWRDSAVRGLTTFSVFPFQPNHSDQGKYVLQVYVPQTIGGLENERFLFDHVRRKDLAAPAVVGRYAKDEFQCQLLAAGEGRGVRPAEWHASHEGLLRKHWACRLPRALVDAFSASRGLLHRRLNEKMVMRLEVAADTERDRAALTLLEGGLVEVQGILEGMPLYVKNADLSRDNVMRFSVDEVLVMSWGKWSLEPIGAELPRRIPAEQLETWITELREKRSDVPVDFTIEHLQLASACWELERAIAREKFNQGLRLVHRILDNQPVRDCFVEKGLIRDAESSGGTA